MTNLEYLASKGMICANVFTDGDNKSACNLVIAIRDDDIEEYDEYKSPEDYLLARHKERIELTIQEHDLLMLLDVMEPSCVVYMGINSNLIVIKNNGKSKGVGKICDCTNIHKCIEVNSRNHMLPREILDYCD